MRPFLRRVLAAFTLGLLGAALWWLDPQLPGVPLARPALTVLAGALVYLPYAVLVEVVTGRIGDPGSRYAVRKGLRVVALAFLLMVVAGLWMRDHGNAVLAGGLLAAGLAVALQDVVRSFVGGLVVFVTRLYGVGDRITVGDTTGDVVDVDVLYTTLMEVQRTGAEGRATGGLSHIPNHAVLASSVTNFTKEHSFLWDEVELPLSYGSDRDRAREAAEAIAREATEDIRARARGGLPRFLSRYYMTRVDLEPSVSIRVTDDYVVLRLRYLTEARRRGSLRTEITHRLLEAVEEDDALELGSSSLNIGATPRLQVDLADGPDGGEDPGPS